MLINKNSGEPVYMQIINQYKRQVASGALKPHDKLPSVRRLSYELGINPNTLQKSFSQMETAGICYSLPGKGRFICEDAVKIIEDDAKVYFDALDNVIESLVMCNLNVEEIVSRVRKSYSKAVVRINS